jgi:hypothetical protein
MKCNQLICAQSAITDRTTNNVSIINICENLLSSLFPFQIPILTLWLSLEREEGDELTVTPLLTISLNEQVLFQQPITITFIDGDPKNNTTANMQGGLIINNPGTLRFAVSINNNELKSYSFTIGERH